MAEIFSAPEEIKQPELNFESFDKYEQECDQYLIDLKDHIQSMGYKGKNVGEIIRLPWADGSADYMVLSMRPMRLIHIPLGDAWDHPDADQLTAKRVQEKLDSQKAMELLFANNKK